MLNKIYTYPGGLRIWSGGQSGGPAGDHRLFIISTPYEVPPLVTDGDYALFFPIPWGAADNLITAPIVYRWKENVPIVPTGSDIDMWLPPEVYGGSPQVLAYLEGGESDVDLGIQGFAITEVNAGEVTNSPSDNFTRVIAPTAGDEAYLTMPTVLGSQRFYLRCDLRGTIPPQTGAGFATGGIVQNNTEVNTQYTFGRVASSQFWRAYAWDQVASTWSGSIVPSVTVGQAQAGNVTSPSVTSGAYWSFQATANQLSNLVETNVGGLPMVSSRRNADSAIAGDNMTLSVQVTGTSISVVQTVIDVRQLFLIVW
jgi:hypothetical protein